MEFGYGYDQGYQDGKNQAKSDKATKEAVEGFFGFTGSVLCIITGLLFACVLYSGALILSYAICQALGVGGVKSMGVRTMIFLAITYVMLCGFYFLKGLLIALKARKNQLWVMIWVVCVLMTCVFPAYTLQIIISGLFKNPFVSWTLAVIAGLVMYFYYKLKVDRSPLLTRWSYRLGKKAGVNS